jgi:hypothetical protein
LEKLKPDTAGPIFLETDGDKDLKLTFEFNSKTGDLKIVNADPLYMIGFLNESDKIYIDNYTRYKTSGVVTDCVVIQSYDRAVNCAYVSRPDKDHALSIYNDYNLEMQRIGKKVSEVFNRESKSKCKVTDDSISSWYKGECVNGYASGYGIAVGKSKYEGEFKNGMKHGKGIYTQRASYLTYTGDFTDDCMTGRGTLKWRSKETFINKRGDKTEKYASQLEYVGEVVNGNATGEGTLKYIDGDSYKPVVLTGFFFNNKLLSRDELHAYKMQNDIEYASNYKLEQYRQAFNSAYSSSDLQKFITQYQSNDSDGLIIKAKSKLPEALNREAAQAREQALREYRHSFEIASNSYEYNKFILKYTNNDPDDLVGKAKSLKSSALKSEKENFDSVSRASWSPNYKVKVTFKTSPGKAIDQLQKVVSAVKVRDPGGLFNPYWVPTFHASAAYDDKGIVVGEWYASYYIGFDDWNRYLIYEMSKLDIADWNVAVLGETKRPTSDYAVSPSNSATYGSLSSPSSSNSSTSNSSASQAKSGSGYKIIRTFPLENQPRSQVVAEVACGNGKSGYVRYNPSEQFRKYSTGAVSDSIESANGDSIEEVAREACKR